MKKTSRKKKDRKLLAEAVDRSPELLNGVANAVINGFSLDDAARVLGKVKDGVTKDALGGEAKFTGNNRTYRNGAIGYEVECAKCHLRFWVTNWPYALCIDCDPKAHILDRP